MQTSNALLKIRRVGRCKNCESFEIKWVLNSLFQISLFEKQICDTTFTHYFSQENYKTTAFFIAYFGLQPDQTWKWSYCCKYKYVQDSHAKSPVIRKSLKVATKGKASGVKYLHRRSHQHFNIWFLWSICWFWKS